MDKKTIVLVLVLVFVYIKGFLIEPNSIEVTKYQIQNPSLSGVRIAFLSDLHLKKNDYKRLDKIVNTTNAQNPDLVFIGGGYIYNNNPKKTMDYTILAQKLSFIKAQKYSVLSNEDVKDGGDNLRNNLENNKIKVLSNSNSRIILKKRYIDIIGISDVQGMELNTQKAFKKTKLPRIVITHNPDIYYDIIDATSIILAGHTHGGQFVLPFSPPLYVASKYGTKFAKGMIAETNNTMIISKGLGTSGIPIRFNCKPEIVIVEFN